MDLNIKVIGNNIHTSVYDKREDFGFPIVNFPWLSGDVPRLPSHVVLAFSISILKISFQITSKLLTQGYRYHMLRKNLESCLGHTLNFCPDLVQYRRKNMYLKESLTQSSTVILSTN